LAYFGGDVKYLVLDILNNATPTDCINKTYIVLIPKVKNPSSPKEFKAISLCNVVMKIVTKVIANRIKVILPDIIDEEQFVFVHGKLITDNALIAMECFHWLKKKKGKKGIMALKLDMAKAYDRLECPFIKATLFSMRFPARLVATIMNCISTVSYQILVNGQPSKNFTPERGLRQGDPISSYLFILCVDVISGLLKKADDENKIHGIKIAKTAPQMSHLFFVDDSLLFARGNLEEVDSIFHVFSTYQ
jgi:hypothetical protein